MGCAILFGIAEEEEGRIYDTAVAVERGRFIGRYRKIHLSDLEKRVFARGTENPVLEIAGAKVGIQICFDLWFPEVSREQIARGADLLCALAAFGGETTATIARTRAIENMTPLVLCNRIGAETIPGLDATFLGKSQVIARDGEILSLGKAGEFAYDVREFPVGGGRRSNVICGDLTGEIALHHR